MLFCSAPRGWQHTRSAGAQSAASMVFFMAVVTLMGYPPWYTVSIRVVLATSAGDAGTAPGIQSLGAACHLGVGSVVAGEPRPKAWDYPCGLVPVPSRHAPV